MKSSNAKPATLKRMLNAAVARLVTAALEEAESGQWPPETWPDIERELQQAKADYNRIRNRIFERIS